MSGSGIWFVRGILFGGNSFTTTIQFIGTNLNVDIPNSDRMYYPGII